MSATAVGQRAEVRVQITPPWPLRLTRRSGMDGLSPVRNGVLHRLIHLPADPDQRLGAASAAATDASVPVYLRVAQLSSGDVLIGAMSESAVAADDAIVRMRRAIGVDVDLKPFHDRFRDDPWIGAAVRANPLVRPSARPVAFEALACAVSEQLIEFERAVAIQRRMIRALGRRDELTGLRDSPTAAAIAGVAPAQLESMDLVAKRAHALIRVAQEVASGRVDVETTDPVAQEQGWARLRRIPQIGAWTTEILAITGQGRYDQIPAGDLGFIKLVGRLLSGGDPNAYATEQQVREVFARFGDWKGLAGVYALRAAKMSKSPIT